MIHPHLTAIVAAMAAAALGAPLLASPPASAAPASAAPALAAPAFEPLTAAALVRADFTVYFANSGAQVTDSVATGDHLGVYQSGTDQPYGPDAGTGISWGFVADETSNPIASSSTGNDKLAAVRYDSEPAGADLAARSVKYAFDLPDGPYSVTFGLRLPGGWGDRSVVLAAEGLPLETVTSGTSLVERTVDVEVADGVLDLAVQSPADRTDPLADPAVSYLIVRVPPTWDGPVLAAKIAESTPSEPERAGYAPDSLAGLDAALAAAQALVDAGSTDAAAIEAAYALLTATHDALRAIVTYDSFRPGEPWLDNQGRAIQAHGGQVVTSTDDAGATIYYWYGEDRSNGYSASPGVHVYSSRDLYNWTDRGLALRTMTSTGQFASDPYFRDLYAGYSAAQQAAVWRDLSTTSTDPAVTPAILERPKVIYNATTHQWVMWVHADGPSATSNAQYAKAQAGVAVSDSPFGPFRYIDSYRLDVAPAGEPNYQPGSPGMARDMNLFVDDDGTGYIVYSSEENYSLFVSKLDSAYTALSASPATAVKGVDFTRPYIGAHREAPALFKFDGTYYLITSGATGWSANPASYATAESILGEWTDRGNPVSGPGASDTFSSQSTSVLPIDAAAGRFLFMGDRWTPADLANAPYVWLPLSFGEGGSLALQGPAQWRLEDLRPTTRYTVAAELPDHAWLGDASALPTTVAVTTGGVTTTEPVVWDTAGLAEPGVAALSGTLPDGKTFTRSLVVVPRDLLYAVNAGGAATADWTTITRVAASEGALLNTVPDQPYGADPSLATTWGYQVAASGTYGGAGDTIFSTLRYAKAGSDLTYRFDGLAPGSYTVHAGYFDPWPQANRAARVTVNAAVVAPEQTFTAENSAATYPDVVVGADGVLTYTLTPTRSPDIQVSWVMVARPRVAQTITFAGPAYLTFGDADLAGGATASSGLPVTYATTGDCTLVGANIHPTGAGTCTITASQTGSDDVRPAANVTRTFGVRPPVLDDFDRASGPVGGDWGGATGARSYRLAHHRLVAGEGGPLVFGTTFGPTQEASVTLATIDRGGPAQGLLLKVQAATTPDGGALVVAYDARAGAVRLSSIRGGHARGTSYPKVDVRFFAGDVLTARATADGDVRIARNGADVAVVTLSAADQQLFNPLGGRIGIWTHDSSRSVFDDFRGGSIGS